MPEEHECKCSELPAVWGPCLQMTGEDWSSGCEQRMQDRACEHLAFPTRESFIEWAAGHQPNRFAPSFRDGDRRTTDHTGSGPTLPQSAEQAAGYSWAPLR
jgi:hypothetical protein